jgi:hypothetical protein
MPVELDALSRSVPLHHTEPRPAKTSSLVSDAIGRATDPAEHERKRFRMRGIRGFDRTESERDTRSQSVALRLAGLSLPSAQRRQVLLVRLRYGNEAVNLFNAQSQ